MQPEAYCFHQSFDPEGPSEFRMDRHYLLYAREGTMRLEAEGRRWTLPPARAALIAAGQQVTVTILSKLTTASVLFQPGFIPAPPNALSVFEVTPLARELIAECRAWGSDCVLDDYARKIFATLGDVALRLAANPSPSSLPAPASVALKRALELTEAEAAGAPSFESVAKATGQSPRALARRFATEMGMTWREALRRIRLIRAIEALALTDQSVTQVALDVGYGSLSAFNAAFRDLTGKSPGQYRASFRD
jgi:AraC-like DNA-binding protein